MLKYLASIVSAVFSLKTFMAGFFVITLGIILYNFAVEIIGESLTWLVAKLNGVEVGEFSNPSFTGFAGWFASQIKVPECIAVIVSAVSLKFILRKIPFINW